ncbi:MAG: hypothetical protein MSG78_06430 [Clostridiales bacterium]|nr:hypothetical protein [Clostridiales bacterium]
MKIRVIRRIVTVIIIVGICFWGISQKQTYTNLLSEPNALNKFQVAEFPESLMQSASDQFLHILPQSSIIIRAIAVGEKDYLFHTNQQTVFVQQVYQGEGIQSGEKIHVALRTGFSFRDSFDGKLAELSFVNEMEEGKEYLIFLDKKIDVLRKNDQYDVYYVADSLIAPIFGYENRENVVVDVSGNISTYVPYSLVSGNEFFAATQSALDEFMNIKRQLLERYPR